MRYYVIYGTYGIYNLVVELVTLRILLYSIPCINVLIWPTEFFEMKTSDSFMARYLYFPIVQGSVWYAAIVLNSLLIYFVNRLYLYRLASIVDPTKITVLTSVVYVVFNFVSITALVFIFKYSGH